MTSRIRASLGFDADDTAVSPGEALKSFDPAAYAPKPRPSNDRPDKAAVRKAGAAAGFVSREGDKPAAATPAPATPARRQRHLTGRSEQVNVRATPEVKARFQAIAEKAFQSDAAAFEKAIELLELNYESIRDIN